MAADRCLLAHTRPHPAPPRRPNSARSLDRIPHACPRNPDPSCPACPNKMYFLQLQNLCTKYRPGLITNASPKPIAPSLANPTACSLLLPTSIAASCPSSIARSLHAPLTNLIARSLTSVEAASFLHPPPNLLRRLRQRRPRKLERLLPLFAAIAAARLLLLQFHFFPHLSTSRSQVCLLRGIAAPCPWRGSAAFHPRPSSTSPRSS